MHQELLSLWGGKIKKIKRVEGGGNQTSDAGSGWRKRQTGMQEGVRVWAGKKPVTAASLRRGAQGWDGSGCLCGHLCFGPASPCLWQPGCGTWHWAGSLSYPSAREVATTQVLVEDWKELFVLWEGLCHQFMSFPCFLRFFHFRILSLSKLWLTTFIQLLKFLWRKTLGSKDLILNWICLVGSKAIEHWDRCSKQ